MTSSEETPVKISREREIIEAFPDPTIALAVILSGLTAERAKELGAR